MFLAHNDSILFSLNPDLPTAAKAVLKLVNPHKIAIPVNKVLLNAITN
jgi:hypothetical protein